MIGLLRKPLLTLGLFVVSLAGFWYASVFHIVVPHLGDADRWPRLVTYFLLGTVFYLFRERIPCSSRLAALALVVWLASVIFHGVLFVAPFCNAYLLFWLAYSPAINLHQFGEKRDLSYGVYLYGWPIEQLLVQHIGRALNVYTLTALALGISAGLAMLSWHFVEKPFLKRKRKATVEGNPNREVAV